MKTVPDKTSPQSFWSDKLACCNCGNTSLTLEADEYDDLGLVNGKLTCSHCQTVYNIKDGVYYMDWNVHEQIGSYGEAWRVDEFESLIPAAGTLYKSHAEWLEQKLGYSPKVAKLVSEYESNFTKGRMIELLPVKQDDIILDLGCGIGYITYTFLSENEDKVLNPICLDVLPKHVEFVRQRQKQQKVAGLIPIVGNAEHIPLADNLVNAILCSEVMEHVPNPKECATEIFRVMASGAQLVISTPNRGPYERYNRVRLALRKMLGKGPGPSEDFYDSPLDHNALISYLKEAGFIIKNVEFGIKVPFSKRFFMYFPEKAAVNMVNFLEKILPDSLAGVSILVKCLKPSATTTSWP